MDRYSEYRVMWILVFFDLPTETQKDKKAYALFRKNLQKDGFTMFQFSIYIRLQKTEQTVTAKTAMLLQF